MVLSHYTCDSSQGKGIGIYGDLFYQSRGTYLPGAEELSNTDHEGAHAPQRPTPTEPLAGQMSDNSPEEAPETGT